MMKIKLFLLSLFLLVSPVWGAAPTYVANATDSSTSDIGTHTVNLPTHSNGDLLALCFGSTHTSDPAEDVTTPSGWTLIGTGEKGGTSAIRLSVFTKFGNGSETTVDVSFTTSTSGFTSVAASYSGVDAVTADASAMSTATGTANSMIAPTVTTTVTDTIVIRCNSADDNDPTSTNWDDSLVTAIARNYIETSGPGNGMWTALVDNTQASAAATGTETFRNGSSASEHYQAATMAFAPSSGAVENRIRIIN
jgi:hypothetical protein